jgi:hypothetical protein
VKLHPRTLPVQAARIAIEEATLGLAEKRGLTWIELARCLGEIQQTALKYALRAERHPDDPDARADEAPTREAPDVTP